MKFPATEAAVAVYLKRTGMSQEELAQRIGMTDNTLRRRLNGRNDFTLPEAVRLSELLGVSLDQLAGRAPLTVAEVGAA